MKRWFDVISKLVRQVPCKNNYNWGIKLPWLDCQGCSRIKTARKKRILLRHYQSQDVLLSLMPVGRHFTRREQPEWFETSRFQNWYAKLIEAGWRDGTRPEPRQCPLICRMFHLESTRSLFSTRTVSTMISSTLMIVITKLCYTGTR